MKTSNLFLIACLLACSSTAQAEVTHLGLPATRLVTLELASDANTVCSSGRSFFRLLPYGVREDTPYQVPNGKDLIITDVVWIAVESPTAFTPGRLVNMRLNLHDPDGTYRTSPFRATPVLTTSEHGTMIGGSDHIQSGVRINQGKVLCPYAISESSNSGAANTVTRAVIHGYHVLRN